jgi:glycine/D-amino acid oxidase-like deaminating enzyme
VLYDDRPDPFRCVMCGSMRVEGLEVAEAPPDNGEIDHGALVRFLAALIAAAGDVVLQVPVSAIQAGEGKVLWMSKDADGNMSAWLVADEVGH